MGSSYQEHQGRDAGEGYVQRVQEIQGPAGQPRHRQDPGLLESAGHGAAEENTRKHREFQRGGVPEVREERPGAHRRGQEVDHARRGKEEDVPVSAEGQVDVAV